MRKGPSLTYNEAVPREKRIVYPKGLFDSIFGNRFMREHFKKWSLHGILPVVLGAGVVIEGHSAIEIRSLMVVACAIWVSLDVAIYVSEGNCSKYVKALIWSSVTSVLFCAAMGCMYWFLESVLEDQQNDVYAKMTIQPYTSQSHDFLKTGIAVINNGKTDIQDHTILTCSPKSAQS